MENIFAIICSMFDEDIKNKRQPKKRRNTRCCEKNKPYSTFRETKVNALQPSETRFNYAEYQKYEKLYDKEHADILWRNGLFDEII